MPVYRAVATDEPEPLTEIDLMAATYWNGSDGAADSAANWTNGVPDSTHTPAVCDGRSQRSLSSGLDFGADIFQFITTPNYRGNVGGPGNELRHGTNTARHIIRGTGTVYIGSAPTTIITQVVVDSENLVDALVFGGSIGQLDIKSGGVTLTSVATFGVAGAGTRLALHGERARLTIAQKAASETLPYDFHVLGGYVANARDFAAATQLVNIAGGTLRQTGLFKSTMRVHLSGGIIEYVPATSPSAEAPYFWIDSGLLDVSESEYPIPKTLVIIGPTGAVNGTAVENLGGWYDIDLRDDYP